MPMQPGTLIVQDEALVDAINTNPLWLYRKANKFALRNVAARMGRSQTTVMNWECGTAYPTDDNMKLIAKLMKLELDDLCKQWREWWTKNHQPEQPDGNQTNNEETKREE